MTDRRDGAHGPAWRTRNSEGGQVNDAINYIERLIDRPAEEAVPKLLEVLRDESWFLRDRAGKALVGSSASQPCSGHHSSAQACEASAPTSLGWPCGGRVSR